MGAEIQFGSWDAGRGKQLIQNLDKTDLEAIWKRVSAVDFDESHAAFPFVSRLARDNNWSESYAVRVLHEYRRFACLAMVGGREVTPSDEVDQAWHLHLLYTRHYWGVWTKALGRKLHHGPTEGGSSEAARYRDNYLATLDLYKQHFHQQPPVDIWPSVSNRFRNPKRFIRLDTENYFIFNRWKRKR